MSTIPVPRPYVNRSRKPLPQVPVTGTLQTGIGTGLADLFNEAAVLTIHGPTGQRLYWLGAVTDQGKIVALRLRQFVTGKLYTVALNGDSWECDCPDATYRQRQCKHVVGLHGALTAATADLPMSAITEGKP